MTSVLLLACGGASIAPPGDADAGAPPPPLVDDGCPSIFAQDILPEYEVEIAPDEWAKLDDEFIHRQQHIDAGLDPHPYHPIQFRYQGGAPIPDVMIRLKGKSSWRHAIALDARPKMQFVISFNQIDNQARFHGVRKLDLDMPRDDRSFLRQRLALSYLRDLGIEAQCANNARLVINGTYYGLYTGLEHYDKELLQRVFPHAADGNLWDAARTIQTNDTHYDWARLDAFWSVESPAQLAVLADLPAALHEWAAEVMIGHGDGYYGGSHNYYLYDHPSRGFVWMPADLDAAIDFYPADLQPIFTRRADQPRLQWLLVMNDPAWRAQFVQALVAARAGYHVDVLQQRVDAWAAQIGASAADDAMKPFTAAEHFAAVAAMRDVLPRRAAYLDAWLDCLAHGGVDADGDGSPFCHDCDDHDATAHPDAPEACNKLDDDCDGYVDEQPVGMTCP